MKNYAKNILSMKRNTKKEKRKKNKGYPYKKLNRKKENEKNLQI